MLIYSHNFYSQGARELARALGIKRIRHNSSSFRGRSSKLVLNWGASRVPDQVLNCQLINHPHIVAVAINKLYCFEALKVAGVSIPDFTTSDTVPQMWIEEGHSVVCRSVLEGSGGRGIVLADNVEQLVEAPLYTKYIKKQEEYRVHVGQITGPYVDTVMYKAFDIQQKARNRNIPDEQVNWRIRNYEKGFIYKRINVNPPECVLIQAKNAIGHLGLDFGAVDVIYNSHEDKAYVLEVNTAPGLEGTTVEKYAEYFEDNWL